jgi:hypothetical protein
MGRLETQGRRRRRLFIVLGASFTWVALLCIWFFAQRARVPKVPNALLSHPWAIMALVLGATALFWILFWRGSRSSKRPRGLVFLKLCSDALIIALFGGLLLWNWPPAALILVGFGLALSYAARLIRAAIALSAGRAGGR